MRKICYFIGKQLIYVYYVLILLISLWIMFSAISTWAMADPIEKIKSHNSRFNLPVELIIGVAIVESGANPHVRRGAAGEVGMFQIKPATGRWIGCGNIFTVEGNIDCGLKHLSLAYAKCGTVAGAAKLHNAGLGASCNATPYSRKVIAAGRKHSEPTVQVEKPILAYPTTHPPMFDH